MNRSKNVFLGVLALAGAAAFVLVPACAPRAEAPVNDATTFKNVKILTGVSSKSEMRRIMKEQAAALGVKCSHCHVPGKFELDDKEPKRVAREMMTMAAKLNATVFKESEHAPAITCWTCHRGSLEPERDVPAAAFDAADAQQ